MVLIKLILDCSRKLVQYVRLYIYIILKSNYLLGYCKSQLILGLYNRTSFRRWERPEKHFRRIDADDWRTEKRSCAQSGDFMHPLTARERANVRRNWKGCRDKRWRFLSRQRRTLAEREDPIHIRRFPQCRSFNVGSWRVNLTNESLWALITGKVC